MQAAGKAPRPAWGPWASRAGLLGLDGRCQGLRVDFRPGSQALKVEQSRTDPRTPDTPKEHELRPPFVHCMPGRTVFGLHAPPVLLHRHV